MKVDDGRRPSSTYLQVEDMASELFLSDGVFIAQIEDDIVVLDVEADAYHCLLDATQWMVVHQDGRVIVGDPGVEHDLTAAGFCVRTTSPRKGRIGLHPPRRELAIPSQAPRLLSLVAAASLVRSTWAFQNRPLAQLIAPPSVRGRDRALPEDGLERAVAAAKAALPWVPGEGECLQRAFELRRFLAEKGFGTTWMFGVKTWPFAAHCWLQIDDMVVGDTVERVSRYTPIMAV